MNEDTMAMVWLMFMSILLLCVALPLMQSVPNKSGKNRFEKSDYQFSGKMKFAGGLNLPSSTICVIHCLRSKLVIEAHGQEFHLATNKIISATIMKKTELQRQYVSNAGGAVAGALIAGPIGALIGGSPSQKRVYLKSKYFVIAYEGEEKTEYILFDATYNSGVANRLNDHYKYLQKRANVHVDL